LRTTCYYKGFNLEVYIKMVLKKIEKLGRKQTTATKRKIAKALMGSKNPAWVDGRHPTHYRRVAGAKPGDGSIIHHKNGDRHSNGKGNLQKVSKANLGAHDKLHNRADNFKKSGQKGTHNPMKSKTGIGSIKKKKKK